MSSINLEDLAVLTKSIIGFGFGSILLSLAAIGTPINAALSYGDWERFKDKPVDEQRWLCSTDSECEWAFGMPIVHVDPSRSDGSDYRPQLVGLGCEGASGPIYAYYEDHFPKCEDIRGVNWIEWEG